MRSGGPQPNGSLCFVIKGKLWWKRTFPPMATILAFSVATSDVLTSDLMFCEKFLMSDVLAKNLMLTKICFF